MDMVGTRVATVTAVALAREPSERKMCLRDWPHIFLGPRPLELRNPAPGYFETLLYNNASEAKMSKNSQFGAGLVCWPFSWPNFRNLAF